MTTANPSDLAPYRRAVQAPIRRAADDFRRLADALDAAAAEVDRGSGPHPASDLARTVIQQIQAAGAIVDYAGLLRAAADHDALLAGYGGLSAPPTVSSGTSTRLSRRAAAAAAAAPPPVAAPVRSVAPNTLWVDEGRFVWVTGTDAKGTVAECWAWRDQTSVRLRPTTVPIDQFEVAYRLADEQEYRRAAQIIAALRGAGVDVSPMRPLLEYAKKS
ncbi:hypothetical protein [Kutzneria sp. CA-103260]|uniref:hypothetical protein n=1 Tax=Kutzneria sp. CA-103260 TaxID=2802641 RepID=UPI001BA48F1D|nr:hypothetical protein [Kutzneria sp. CA-103260]QUQ63773.1 hypothetical protein JJ691_14860 [Kutzneria sp. CA-103260]